MFAIIKTGGKQYKVKSGDVIQVEKLEIAEGKKVAFDTLMISDGDQSQIGTPLLDTKIEGKVVEHGKGKKVIVFKYKPKKNYRKKTGHRQAFTAVEILDFGGTKKATTKPATTQAKPAAKATTKAAEEKPATKKTTTAAKTTAAEKKPAAKKTTATEKKPTAAKKTTADDQKTTASKTTKAAATPKPAAKKTATKKTEE